VEVACAPIDKAGPRHVSMRQGGAALTWPLRNAGVSITTTVGQDSTTRCTMGEIRSSASRRA
jgi:hypothetical protein